MPVQSHAEIVEGLLERMVGELEGIKDLLESDRKQRMYGPPARPSHDRPVHEDRSDRYSRSDAPTPRGKTAEPADSSSIHLVASMRKLRELSDAGRIVFEVRNYGKHVIVHSICKNKHWEFWPTTGRWRVQGVGLAFDTDFFQAIRDDIKKVSDDVVPGPLEDFHIQEETPVSGHIPGDLPVIGGWNVVAGDCEVDLGAPWNA